MRYLVAETTWKLMGLSQALAESGTLVTRCDQGEDIDAFQSTGEHDLVVLDAGALGKHTTLARLRDARPAQPVCVLARQPDHRKVAEMLNAGADMVLPEDIPLPELVTRLHALSRRAHGVALGEMDCGPLRFDLESRRVHLEDVTLSLSPKLYEILEFLALRPGRLATREQLLNHVYGFENEPAPRVFDVYLCNLRTQLANVAGALTIETVRGSGYRMMVREAGTADGSIAA
ncbi:winged helix-turn-helix domain-containing protein [Salipiger sp.]|uniref:winged helix-turn-helix domain-containing protein n=1 Tax=Salipiger sp. TaxID=2078585 RepID=UPI003A98360A